MVLVQNRHLDQYKIKDPNMSTCNFCHIIFDKDVKKPNLEKRASSPNGSGALDAEEWTQTHVYHLAKN